MRLVDASTSAHSTNIFRARIVRAYLESRRKEMRKIDPGLATFICVSAIEAVAHNTVLNQAEMLSEKMVRTLVDETTGMVVVGYLR